MPNLLSVRFSKVGYIDTRLDGLAYSISKDGEPKNSLIIGSNTGGKTSQLHLLFSIFVPQKNELISQKDSSSRNFAYYFEENEIAFVASEWTIPNSQIDLDGNQKTRVIGRFTQFTNRDKYEHETYFFSFIADKSLGIDDLPITSSIPSRVKDYCRTISEVKKYLRETFDLPGREFYGPSDRMEQWQEYLRTIGFNIDMYRLMMLFTMSEGDPSSFLKKFGNQEAVLAFVTKEVMDKKSSSRLRDMLVQYRDSIISAPKTRAQIAAYDELLNMFRQLEPVAKKLAQATMQHKDALAGLAVVAARIEATLSREQERMSSLQQTQENEKVVLKKEERELSIAEAELRGIKERLAELACLAAKEDHLSCKKRLEEASRLLKAMRAVVDRVAVIMAENERDDLTRRLDALSEPVRSLADELAMAKQLLLEYLTDDMSHASAKAKGLEETEKETTESRKRLENKRQEQETNLRILLDEKERLESAEIERKLSIESMVHAGFLQDGEPPNVALAALEKEVADLGKQRESSREDVANTKIQLATLEEQIKDKTGRIENLKEDHAKLLADRDIYMKRHEGVAGLRGIRDVFELAEPDLFLHGLNVKLQERISLTDNDIRTLEQEISSLKERIDAIVNNEGLLPAAEDVENVVKALRTANIQAYSWWQVFSQQNRSAEESTAETKKDPFRVGGVAVSGERNLIKAQELLAQGCDVHAPVFVSDYSKEIKEQVREGFVVLPDVALATDKLRAEQFCTTAKREIQSKKETIETLNVARAAFKAAEEALIGFLGAYNEKTLDIIENKVNRSENAVLVCSQESQTLIDHEKSARERLGKAETAFCGFMEKLRMTEEPYNSLKDHIASHEKGRPERIHRLQGIASQIKESVESIEQYCQKVAAAETEEKSAREKAEEGKAAVKKIKEEIDGLGGIRKPPTETFRQQATSTQSARTLHEEKVRALDSANADAEYIRVKERFEGAREKYSKIKKQWDSDHGKTPAADIEIAEARLSGAIASESDFRRASEEEKSAIRVEAEAEHVLKTRKEEENKCKKDHQNLSVTRCDLDHEECASKEEILLHSIVKLKESISLRRATVTTRDTELNELINQIKLLKSLDEQMDIPSDVQLPAGPQLLSYANYEDAKSAFQSARKTESEAVEQVAGITESLRTLNSDLSALLDSETCQSIATMVSHIKEEIHRCHGFLKDDIKEFSNRIYNALEPLKYELDQHEKNEHEVINQVVLDVGKAFRFLSNFEKRSKIPALGGIWRLWTGKPFIRFRTQVKPDSEQARQAVAGAITAMAQTNEDLPAGDIIILSALRAVLGNAYVIDTLKPNTSPTTEYFGITHPTGLCSWSGGQKLSGAVLFYMALCNLLSIEGQTGSTLLIDNPFGSCNNIEFIRLIVALTHQYGVQIVAFTPTEDKEIRRLFPLNIMIRKGGADGINKNTGRPVVKYDETIYNDGELALLEINREVSFNAAP